MEDNSKKNEHDKTSGDFDDFKDFDDDEEMTRPELDEELASSDKEEDNKQEEVQNIDNSYEEPNEESNKESEESLGEETQEKDEENSPQEDNLNNAQEQSENQPELSQWEELSADNSVVKKYILYISKDFVPYIDNLSTDERSAYINDAIQKKIDLEDEAKQKQKKIKLLMHFVIMIITFCIVTPLALLGVNKAIMLTFENYRYSQENFEKLYKQRFEKDRAYMRSLEYNKEQQKKRAKR